MRLAHGIMERTIASQKGTLIGSFRKGNGYETAIEREMKIPARGRVYVRV